MRIIAGEFRSRRLKSLPGVNTRPTPDRLRETLFDILQTRIPGATFLDAYAGTGAVGMEALSRGATHAWFLEKIRPYTAGAMPITGMVGATASLKSKNLVAERRKILGDIREDTFNFLTAKNVDFIPSESNCFMMDVKRPGKGFYQAMAAEKVFIGRAWPVWPQHVRVSVGTKEEMAKFKEAFAKVYNS